MKYDYDELLKRMRTLVPDRIAVMSRHELPRVLTSIEGRNTIIRNFGEIVKKLNRDPQHLMKFLARELGTAVEPQGEGRVALKGRYPPESIEKRLQLYVRTYVMCYECGSWDTELVKRERVEFVVCHACGAERPVHAVVDLKKVSVRLKEGEVYEIMISDVSREGTGVAYVGDYSIYVRGAKRGDRLRVRITKIFKKKAFAEIVERL